MPLKALARLSVAAAAALLLAAPPAGALIAQDQEVVDRGLDVLYRGDIDGSRLIFEQAVAARPGDAALSLGLAVASWWRMENDFAPPGSPEEKRFLADVERAIADGTAAVARGEDAEAWLCLGAAYGLRSRLAASRKQWFRAYRDGRRAYRSEQRALRLEPGLIDAYLGLGAFDYYVATLPGFVRLLAFGKGAGKARGLEELRVAAQGRFSGMAAKLILVGILWTFEKQPREAWAIVEELHGRYPDSPLIESMRLIGLFRLRDAEGLVREARRFLERARGGTAFYRPIDQAVGLTFLGLGELLAGRCEDALAHERAALELIPEGHRLRGLPRLFIGECLDLLGRRGEAVASYRQTLKEPGFWGVPRAAKRNLKHPFRADENPLPSRSDELE